VKAVKVVKAQVTHHKPFHHQFTTGESGESAVKVKTGIYQAFHHFHCFHHHLVKVRP